MINRAQTISPTLSPELSSLIQSVQQASAESQSSIVSIGVNEATGAVVEKQEEEDREREKREEEERLKREEEERQKREEEERLNKLRAEHEDIKESLNTISEWYDEDKPSFNQLKDLAESEDPQDHAKLIKHYAKSLVVHAAKKDKIERLQKNIEEQKEELFDRWENKTGNRVDNTKAIIEGVEELRKIGGADEQDEQMSSDAQSCDEKEEYLQGEIAANRKTDLDDKIAGKLIRKNNISQEKLPDAIEEVANELQQRTSMSDPEIQELKAAAWEDSREEL